MKKGAVLLIIALLEASFLITLLRADGGMVIYDDDMFGWKPLQEETQMAFINYQEGVQKMIIGVSVKELEGSKAAWIFPIKAAPEQTSIDLLKEIPRLVGKPLKESLNQDIKGSFWSMSLSQIYTAPLIVLSMSFVKRGTALENTDLQIYEHIEKMGLTSELVSAKKENALKEYMTSKSLSFPEELNSIINEYINQDYCFVISWISDVDRFKSEYSSLENYNYGSNFYSFGIYSEFPTEEIYYPLKPTGMYGKKEIPIIIYVMNYVTPRLYSDIKDKTTIEYFQQNYLFYSKNLENFFGYSGAELKLGPNSIIKRPLEYTKIKIQVPADRLTQDLIIENKEPEKVKFYRNVEKNLLWFMFLIFIILSCLSSLISGTIFFWKNKPYKLRFLLFGLFNFLTIIGFSIAACLLRIDERFVREKETKKKRNIEIKKAMKIGGVVSLIIAASFMLLFSPLWFIGLHFFSIHNIINILYFIVVFLFIFIPCFLILTPLIYAGRKNKKLLGFLITFSVLFNMLLIITAIIIGIFL